MLTVKQAAKKIGVCPSVIYGWCKDRFLPHYRVGHKGRGKIMIDEEELTTTLEKLKVREQQPAQVTHRKPAPVLKHLKLKTV